MEEKFLLKPTSSGDGLLWGQTLCVVAFAFDTLPFGADS